MNTETTERQHHPYSPSTLQSREACPRYDPAFTESEAATMGTMQHNAAESGVDDERLPDYKALAVAEAMKFVDERFRLYPGGQLFKEDYLPIDDEKITIFQGPIPQTYKNFTGTTAGYVDAAIVSADELTLEVLDHKFGAQGVEQASNNLQGISYLLGLKKKFPRAIKGFVWFILPHRDEVSGAEFDLTDVSKLHLRVKTVVARAIQAHKIVNDFSMANATTSACLFCANLGRCPKVAELALKLGKKYRPLEIPASVSTTVFSDPADIERGLKFAAVIKMWAEAYRTQVTAKTIEDPNFVPKGYDLVSMSKRKVISAKKLGELAKEYLPEELKEKIEALYDISLGPLEKLISTAAPRGQKEKTVDEFSAKAIEQKFIEEGAPFAFLRQSKKAASE